jgi:hypothetical protein
VTFVRSFMAYRRDAPAARGLFPDPESPIEEEGD